MMNSQRILVIDLCDPRGLLIRLTHIAYHVAALVLPPETWPHLA